MATESPFNPADFTKISADFTKFFESMRTPGVNLPDVMAAHQKNLEALTKANQALAEGVQAVIRREMEIMQRAIEDAAKASQEIMTETDPAEGTRKRLHMAREAYKTGLDNMQELVEMTNKSTREALEVFNKRAMEQFEEFKSAVDKAKG